MSAGDAISFGTVHSDVMLIRYANANSYGVQATVQVNGTAVETVRFQPTGGWSTYGQAQVHVPVNGVASLVFQPADVAADHNTYILNVDQASTV